MTSDSLPASLQTRRRFFGPQFMDKAFRRGTLLFALVVPALILLLALILGGSAFPALHTFRWQFITTSTWDPVKQQFGILFAIFGTAYSSLLALLIAVPVSLGAALFLAELAPRWLREPISFLVEMLAAVPSIVYGLWGIFVLIPVLRSFEIWSFQVNLSKLPLFSGAPYGVGMLAAGLVLAIMITPFITAVSREVIRAVPPAQREAAYALGGHALGGHQRAGAALRPHRHPGRRHPGPGACAGRNHGRHHGHRQYEGHLRVAVQPGLHPAQPAGQRIQRGVARLAAPVVADLRRANPAHHHLHRQRHRAPADLERRPRRGQRGDGMTTPATFRPRGWRYTWRKSANVLMWVLSILMTLCAMIPLFLVLYHVVSMGLPALNWDLLTRLPKPPGEPGGGMLTAITGTLILIGLSCVVGLPVGILGGIYLAEFGNNRTGAVIRFFADVLASVPSIVIGILIYTVVVLQTKHFSALAGGLALGVMMIPTVTRTTEDLVRLVPTAQREAALSLGVTHVTTVFTVVMVAARAGIITGILLAIARIAGETAPLLFTAFGNNLLNVWRLDQPIDALPLRIFNYAISPYSDWNAQAWAGALILVLLILILSVAARYATRGRFRLVR